MEIMKLKISKNDIDNLILVTQTPSNLIPSSACEIHQRLGLNVDCAAFDINQGCTGYIYGLQVASSIVDSNNSKITLLSAFGFKVLSGENSKP